MPPVQGGPAPQPRVQMHTADEYDTLAHWPAFGMLFCLLHAWLLMSLTIPTHSPPPLAQVSPQDGPFWVCIPNSQVFVLS